MNPSAPEKYVPQYYTTITSDTHQMDAFLFFAAYSYPAILKINLKWKLTRPKKWFSFLVCCPILMNLGELFPKFLFLADTWLGSWFGLKSGFK